MEHPSDATIATTFPWSSVPPEIQLRILENTELVRPTEQALWTRDLLFYAEVRWEILPLPRLSTNLAPYFLVNRAFYEQARYVFWKHTDLMMRCRLSESTDERPPPGCHPLRSLLMERLRPSTVPLLKRLYVQYTTDTGMHGKERERQELLRTVRDAVALGLNLSGVEMLDSMVQSMHTNEPDPQVPLNEASSDEHRVGWFRARVRERTWPFDADTGLPLVVSSQLLVQMISVFYEGMYFIRRISRSSREGPTQDPKGERLRAVWGEPQGTRRIQAPSDDGTEGYEWVEMVWIGKKKKPFWWLVDEDQPPAEGNQEVGDTNGNTNGNPADEQPEEGNPEVGDTDESSSDEDQGEESHEVGGDTNEDPADQTRPSQQQSDRQQLASGSQD